MFHICQKNIPTLTIMSSAKFAQIYYGDAYK